MWAWINDRSDKWFSICRSEWILPVLAPYFLGWACVIRVDSGLKFGFNHNIAGALDLLTTVVHHSWVSTGRFLKNSDAPGTANCFWLPMQGKIRNGLYRLWLLYLPRKSVPGPYAIPTEKIFWDSGSLQTKMAPSRAAVWIVRRNKSLLCDESPPAMAWIAISMGGLMTPIFKLCRVTTATDPLQKK